MNRFTELLEKLGLKNKAEEKKEPEKLGFSQRMKKLLNMEETFEKVTDTDVLDAVLQSDMENLKVTKETVNHQAFSMAVEAILEAKTIYICGIRSCEPLADFLGFYLNMIFDNVKVIHTSSASEILEQMMRISAEDVFIGISFPRYSMRTLKAMELANNRSARVISITDSIHSPMNIYSSMNLLAESQMASVVDSLTAPLSLINALVAALCLRRKDELKESLETLDQLYEDYQIYGNDEMEDAEEEILIYQGGTVFSGDIFQKGMKK